MALGTVQRESALLVRRPLRSNEIAAMAGDALRAQPHKDRVGRPLVAVFAFNPGMRTQKRESVGVLASGKLCGGGPAPRGMALVAVIAKLSTVQVRVAGSAIVRRLLENRIDVALLARHACMHAIQAIGRLGVVIKLRMLPDGRPRGRRMTCLAGNRQRAVRIARALLRLRGQKRSETGEHYQNTLHSWHCLHSLGVPL